MNGSGWGIPATGQQCREELFCGQSLQQARPKVTHSRSEPDAAPPNPLASACFLLSVADAPQLPRDAAPEVAFAGRSNAGKSSALNTLSGQRQLARVSKTPGRTQLINLFALGNGARLADLPGYGYAEVPEAMRKRWRTLIGGYVSHRPNLRGVVIVMDVRHPLTDIDRQMLDWAQAHGRRVHILLTKADKLSFSAARQTLLKIRRGLPADIGLQLFSATTRMGVDEARAAVAALLGTEPAT
jgi:GTP-binding protein